MNFLHERSEGAVRAIIPVSAAEAGQRTGGMAAVFGGDDPAGARPRETGPAAAEELVRRLREFYGPPRS
ncbi:hypothetical protein [Amycolatopsis sp.]|uniref:hypothetical protein n=1 Tax=Amycolatopsis sp. TaxID=37632 RepID=UPI002D804C8D|nr:hypothetical protein [Amycolatopsis sp.]HET6711953.1 hypothetical protein [Amycolatopsis sp.]